VSDLLRRINNMCYGLFLSGAPHIILASCPADEIDISRSGNVIVYMSEELHL
jgi:hypothetical protein